MREPGYVGTVSGDHLLSFSSGLPTFLDLGRGRLRCAAWPLLGPRSQSVVYGCCEIYGEIVYLF